ncbi:hypothetical protein Dxin01_00242 [Deinococcus xinjiangensis]|uniref:Uncharacterized protein n=1 Tax=Deinococcus xinjiangensis TaxID=457454 RepID=A0ABP9V5J0_9DEIO
MRLGLALSLCLALSSTAPPSSGWSGTYLTKAGQPPPVLTRAGWYKSWQGGNGYAYRRGQEFLSGTCQRAFFGLDKCFFHFWQETP